MDADARPQELLSQLDVLARDLERARLAAGAQASVQSSLGRPGAERDETVIPLAERTGSAFTYVRPEPAAADDADDADAAARLTITRPVERTLDPALGLGGEPRGAADRQAMRATGNAVAEPAASAGEHRAFVTEYTRAMNELTSVTAQLAAETARRIAAEAQVESLASRLEAARALVHQAQATAHEAADRAAYAEGRVDALEDALDRALNASLFTRWKWRRMIRRAR